MTDVDALDGTVRDTGIGGTFPAPVDALSGGLRRRRWFGGAVGQRGSRAGDADRPGRRAAGRRCRRTARGRSWTSGRCPPERRSCGTTAPSRSSTGGGAPVQQLDAHQEPVRDVVVAPDGTWAVTAGDGPRCPLGRRPGERPLVPAGGPHRPRRATSWRSRSTPPGSGCSPCRRDHTIITWDMSAGRWLRQAATPALDDRWISNRPQVVDPGHLIVAPTRSGHGLTWRCVHGPGPDTLSVAATFLDPDTGEVVDAGGRRRHRWRACPSVRRSR